MGTTCVAVLPGYSGRVRTGVVLGGGGLVGISYHGGVLKALDLLGLTPGTSDVIVGTSAGALVAAYLGAGYPADAFFEYSHGRRDAVTPSAESGSDGPLFTPMWKSRPELMRRAVGSVVAVASASGHWPSALDGRLPRARLEALFPFGMYSIEDTKNRLEQDLPDAWPRDDLLICTADLRSGQRRAFNSSDGPGVSFIDAVLASVAIPGFFPPVAIGERCYVDSGIVSATSLDLAVAAGCEAILCIVPLGYRPDEVVTKRDPKVWPAMILRTYFTRLLDRALEDARARGVQVLVVEPSLAELKAHGANSMRAHDYAGVAEAACEGTLKLLEEHDGHPALAGLQRSALNAEV